MSEPQPPTLFSPDALAKSVHATLDAALASIPQGHSHAVVFDGTASFSGGFGVKAMYVQRSASGWETVLEGSYDGEHGASGSVKVAKSW